MSERLTSEEIARLFLIADTHSGGITMSRANARAVLLELQERRAADLSAEDVEALRWVRYRLVEYPPESGSYAVRTKAALSVLDRLLNGGK